MLRKTMLLTVMFCFLLTTAYAYPNEQEGFRDLKWGTQVTDIHDNLHYYFEYMNLKKYSRPSDDKNFGLAHVAGITYCFFQDKLHSVELDTVGWDNWVNLKQALKAKFGGGNEPSEYTCLWYGNKTDIYIHYDYINNRTTVQFTSKEIDKLKAEWEKGMAKNANF